MKQTIIIAPVLTLALIFVTMGAETAGATSVNSDTLLMTNRDRAADVVRQVSGKAGADKYVKYLNNLIDQANCYLDGPLATCDYTQENVKDLAAALDEGVRATLYLTADYAAGNARPGQGPVNTPIGGSTENKNNATNSVANRPNSLPNASYETSNASEQKTENANTIAERTDVGAESEVIALKNGSEREAKQEAGARESKSGEIKDNNENEAGKNVSTRVIVAVLASVTILAAGATVIWKWSKSDV